MQSTHARGPGLPPGRFPTKIPTSLTPREAQALRGLSAGKRVVEIGSLLGASTIVLADQANVVFAVDPHEGYPVSNPRPTKTQFEMNLILYGVRDRVIPIFKRAQEAHLPHAELVFIDYTYEAEELMELALRVCKPKVLAIHDFGHELWQGATSAVIKYVSRTCCPVCLVDTLAIIEVPGP